MTCPICRGDRCPRFLHRADVPVHQNALMESEAEARAMPLGDLDLRVCHDCGFIFNAAFDPGKLFYERDYDNSQSCSDSFDHYLDGLARRLLDEHGVRGQRIVEIGCGKGTFLRKLCAGDSGNRGLGYDPSYVGPDRDLDGRLQFERRLYDGASADVVICRHVIEHVADPAALLRAVPAARLFFETPCVEWILRHRVVWDFFYEHCSLFTANSLTRAFGEAGFAVTSVEHTFGGQYLWLEAAPGGARPRAGAGEIPALAGAFATAEATLREQLRARLHELGARGGVALWGAGAKGATLAHLVDPDRRLIRCLVDINPRKQGNFVPGSGHPIVAPERLDELGVAEVLLMNPNYRDEVAARLAGRRATLRLADDELA